MKTNSINSIATLLGMAVLLDTSALAGPGPQTPLTVHQPSQQPTATIALEVNSVSIKPAPVAEGSPKLDRIDGPRGSHFIYRW